MGLLNSVLPYFSPILSPDWTVYKDIKYGATAEETADLYLLNKGVRPTVVFIHGGGWSQGDKSAYEGRARRYALAGFHVVAINYRLAKYNTPLTYWPAQLQDCQAAIRWLRRNAMAFRIDPYRIAAGGDSAGGQLALMLGCNPYTVPGDREWLDQEQSPWVQGVLDMFGPTDLTVPGFRDFISAVPMFGGKTYDQSPDLYKSASPYYKINALMPPTIIFHGTSDDTVPYSQSLILDAKLTQFNVKHKFVTFDGGHEFAKLSAADQISIEMQGLNFLAGVLNP